MADTPEWWSEADDAECALLLMELIDVYAGHLERGCCRPTYPCSNVAAAEDLFHGWLRYRRAESRAHWLRTRQTAHDQVAAA